MAIKFVSKLPSRRDRHQSKYRKVFTEDDERILRRTPEQWAHIPGVAHIGSVNAAASWIRKQGFTVSVRAVNGTHELFVKYEPKKG